MPHEWALVLTPASFPASRVQVASGVPDRRPDHCARIASLALDMLDALSTYEDGLGRPLKVSSMIRVARWLYVYGCG